MIQFKSLYRSSLALLLGVAALGCSGQGGDDFSDDPIALTSDTYSITADGVASASLSVQQFAVDVTDACEFALSYEGEGAAKITKEGVFTATKPNSYKVVARLGEVVSDTITIEAIDAAIANRKFAHKILGYQFTSTGCIGCPALSKALKNIMSEQPDVMLVSSFHTVYGLEGDPMHNQATLDYVNYFKTDMNFPKFILNLRPETEQVSYQSPIEKEIAKQLAIAPTAGVAVKSTFDFASYTIQVDVTVNANRSGNYRSLVLLLEDGIKAYQTGTEEGENYIHNNVVRYLLSGSFSGDKFIIGEQVPAGEDRVRSYKNIEINPDWRTENMRVVAAVVREENGSYVVDNVIDCPMEDGSANYTIIE